MLRRRQPGRPIWGRKVTEWFSQKTSIAGTQIPNWVIVVGAIIIILLILGRITESAQYHTVQQFMPALVGWSDLMALEIVPVVSGKDTAEALSGDL
jgi:hypothetical protein